MNEIVLAVDIGGTKIAVGLIDRDGNLLQLKIIPTDSQSGGEAVIERVIGLCSYILDELTTNRSRLPLAAGVSSAGQIDVSSGSVIYATQNLPGWTGMQIKKRLETALDLPVVVDNDVNCLAVGESAYGAGKGSRHILCLALGTGIGGAMILDGNLYRGWKGSAGELGHLSINVRGRQCYCGARGCLESYVSGPAIERNFSRRLGKNKIRAVLDSCQAQRISLEIIAQLASQGDIVAQDAITEAGYYLGYGLFGLINLLNPESVIIGGGVAALGELLLNETRRVVANLALPSMRDTPILAAHYQGALGSLVGAATLCWQMLPEKN